MRFFASAFVVLFHVRTLSQFRFGPFDSIVLGGDTGVWIFFALSGYLLYKPFLTKDVDLRSYALRRTARIVPGYYVALGALFALTVPQLVIDHPLPYLTGTFTYDIPLRGFLGNAWTLSAEVLFYVTLPFIARAAHGRETAVIGGLGIVSILLSLLQRVTMTQATEWLHGSYPTVFYAFVPGMLLAVLEVRRAKLFARLAKAPYVIVGVACLCLGAVATSIPIPFLTLLGAPLVMGWVLQHRVPGAPFLAFAGGASYALYLWHKDLFIAFGPVGLVIAVVGASLSWALVERPILARAHALANTWRESRVPSTAVVVPAK